MISNNRTTTRKAGCIECQDDAKRSKVVVAIGSVVASPRHVIGVCTACNSLQIEDDPMNGSLDAFIERKLALPGCGQVRIAINHTGVSMGFKKFRGTYPK